MIYSSSDAKLRVCFSYHKQVLCFLDYTCSWYNGVPEDQIKVSSCMVRKLTHPDLVKSNLTPNGTFYYILKKKQVSWTLITFKNLEWSSLAANQKKLWGILCVTMDQHKAPVLTLILDGIKKWEKVTAHQSLAQYVVGYLWSFSSDSVIELRLKLNCIHDI